MKCGFVALAGRPNAGKSTFLNKVLGEKVSIVSDKPQTTRNRILGVYHGDEIQIGFFDLPGIHKPGHKMNRMMMRSVNRGLDDVDLILHFVDISVPIGSGDRYVREFLQQKDIPVILVVNKVDLVNKAKLIPKLIATQDEFEPDDLVPISALDGDNIDKLLEVLIAKLPEGEAIFPEDELTDQSMRFMAAELIREKLLHYTRDEIPHVGAVSIQSWDETEDDVEISALIYIERASQRRIVLGARGSMISKIRQGARRSIQKLVNKPVRLELIVKVKENWRESERMLDELNLKGE